MISRGYVDHCFMLWNLAPSKSKANEKDFCQKINFSMFWSPQHTVCHLTSFLFLCQILSFFEIGAKWLEKLASNAFEGAQGSE